MYSFLFFSGSHRQTLFKLSLGKRDAHNSSYLILVSDTLVKTDGVRDQSEMSAL